MAEAAASKKPHRSGWLRLMGRILITLFILVVAIVAGLFVSYEIWGAPQERAQREQAERFARLSGAARCLAIFDAFAADVEKHYYDPSFAGLDWPKLKLQWRSKAAAAPDDLALYTDVLFQLEQRFPASHLSVLPPISPTTHEGTLVQSVTAPASVCGDRDMGMQLVQIRRPTGVAVVIGEVWPGSPAARAGLAPGWLEEQGALNLTPGHGRLRASFFALTPAEAHKLDDTGSVQLGGVVANSAELQKVLQRRRRTVDLDYDCGAPVPTFESRVLEGGALYVRFDRFEPAVLAEVRRALSRAGPQGVVLDLRSNSGGRPLLGLNMLLPALRLAYLEGDARGLHRRSTDLWTRRYRGPLVVLVGPASASAAEVTASALKREGRAMLVGRRTNGSVLAAKTFVLPDGGLVQLPVSDVVMPDGRRLEGAGVAPDIEVYSSVADLQAGRDATLERGRQVLEQLRQTKQRSKRP